MTTTAEGVKRQAGEQKEGATRQAGDTNRRGGDEAGRQYVSRGTHAALDTRR